MIIPLLQETGVPAVNTVDSLMRKLMDDRPGEIAAMERPSERSERRDGRHSKALEKRQRRKMVHLDGMAPADADTAGPPPTKKRKRNSADCPIDSPSPTSTYCMRVQASLPLGVVAFDSNLTKGGVRAVSDGKVASLKAFMSAEIPRIFNLFSASPV